MEPSFKMLRCILTFAVTVVKENLYKPPPVFGRDHGSPYSVGGSEQAELCCCELGHPGQVGALLGAASCIPALSCQLSLEVS